jgi:PAS domain S-box-containing protein
MKSLFRKPEFRVPIIYGIFSVLWILLSDKLAFANAPDEAHAALYSLIKGLFFVISSTLLIYFLLRSEETSKNRLMNEMITVQRSFNLLFENNPQPMWIYDNNTLEVMAVNPAACRVYGYTADEFRKLKITDLRSPEDIPLLMKTLAEYKDELRQSGPWRHIKKSGEVIMVKVISHPLRSAGIESTLVSVIDLTDQQKTLEELDTAMQERDDFQAFGYTASHDLKAPLRAVIGYSELLQKEYHQKLDDEANNFVIQIHKAGVTMNEMLDDMLTLTGISRKPLNYERVDLTEVFSDAVNNFYLQEPERKVKVTIQPEMEVVADVGALRLITQNLVQNAWKYTKNREVALIQVGSLVNDDGETVFYIKDNGVGFDPSYSTQIFEPFKRAHMNSAIEGMGIGLSIVRRAVERHGGRIWVESESGKGACFYFTLKQKEQTTAPAQRT